MEKRDIKILIIEDDLMLSRIYQAKLGSLGYSVYSDYDGEERLQRAEDVAPNIILLDLMLPKKMALKCLTS